MADLFTRAKTITDKRIVKALDTATKAVATLTELVAAHDHQAEGRARIAELEAQLAEARAALKPSSTGPSDGGSATSTIRAWARSAGLDVPDRGTLSAATIEAYHAAHPDAPQAAG